MDEGAGSRHPGREASAPPPPGTLPPRRWRARFDRYPRTVGGLLAAALLLLALAVAEAGLRLYGLGDPVLYDVDPRFGYRPRPDQTLRRMGGSVVHLNNLGLRTDADWDATTTNKVLFLGDSVTYGGSYVSNADLFSALALRDRPGWTAGNAGVNAWGVENIHGLVVVAGFHPAQAYVTVLIEEDFYRGLAHKPPFFRATKPVLALQEIVPHLLYRARALLAGDAAVGPPDADGAARRAVARLAELDAFIRARGAVHLIYLSPALANLNEAVAPDAHLAALLAEAGLTVTRLQERPEIRTLRPEERALLFHDGVHLSKAGHRVWGDIIRQDLDAALPAAPPASARDRAAD